MKSLKGNVITGTVWSVGVRFLSLFILLGSNIILVRYLSPQEFGQVALILFFTVLANVLVEGGLGGALVRKKNASNDDFSTVFVFNLFVSVTLYLLLFSFSDSIASFYDDPKIEILLKVTGLVLILNAFQLTQTARLMSELKFKQKSIYNLSAVIISSCVGIFLAYKGFGVWSLVSIQLSNSLASLLLLWTFEGFYFRFRFSLVSFKELYAFGVNTSLASLLSTGFDNIYQVILGRTFSISQVGFYYQARKLQDVPSGVINMISQTVVFSSLSKIQDDRVRFRNAYDRITSYISVLSSLCCCLIFVYSDDIVSIIYGSEWMESVFYMKILTIASFFYILEQLNRTVFKIYNKTHQILFLEIVKKIIQSATIIVGVWERSLELLLYGFVVTNAVNYFINFYYSRKILGYFDWHEIFRLGKIILCSVISVSFMIYGIESLDLDGIYGLLTLPFFLIMYAVILRILKVMNIHTELKQIVK